MKVLFDIYHITKYNQRKQTKKASAQNHYSTDIGRKHLYMPVKSEVSFTGFFDFLKRKKTEKSRTIPELPNVNISEPVNSVILEDKPLGEPVKDNEQQDLTLDQPFTQNTIVEKENEVSDSAAPKAIISSQNNITEESDVSKNENSLDIVPEVQENEIVIEEDDKMLMKAMQEFDSKLLKKYLNKKFTNINTLKDIEDEINLILKKQDMFRDEIPECIFGKKMIIDCMKETFFSGLLRIKIQDDKSDIKKKFEELLSEIVISEDKSVCILLMGLCLKSFDSDTRLDNLKKILNTKLTNNDISLLRGTVDYQFIRLIDNYALEKIFEENPDLKDGIYTFKDFLRITTSQYFKDSMYNIEINDEGDTLIDAFIGILPTNKEEEKLQKDILKNFKSYFILKTDKYGRNYAYKAVDAENIVMIKFFMNICHDNFFYKSKIGESALDLVKKSDNPEIKKLFEGVKLFCPDFIGYARTGLLEPMKELYKTGYVDINEDDIVCTALGAAISRDYTDIVNWLLSLDGIKFIANKQINGLNKLDSILKIAIDKKSRKVITECFPKISGKELGLNDTIEKFLSDSEIRERYGVRNKYGNRHMIYNVFEYIFEYTDSDMMRIVLEHPDANPNIHGRYFREPIVFEILKNNQTYRIENYFKVLCESGKLDFSVKNSDGDTILDVIKKMPDSYLKKKYLNIIEKSLTQNFINDIKKRVIRDGVLSLININEILEHPSIKDFINEKYSDTDETLAHLLADISTDYNNMFEMLKAAQKIISINPKLFLEEDKYHQSAIERVIFAENIILLEYLIKNIVISNIQKQKYLQLANSVSNPEIIDIISKAVTNS